MPRVNDCNFCEFESLPPQPLWTDGWSGSHRCAEHRGVCLICKETFGSDVQIWRDLCNRCTLELIEHRGLKPCVVCTEQYHTYSYGDHIVAAIPGTKRCVQHPMHCARCHRFSVEDDAEDLCNKCKRDDPHWRPYALDMGLLVADNMFCLHTAPGLQCGMGVGDCNCRCCHCYQYNAYATGMRLPLPPTEEQERQEALLQRILAEGHTALVRLAGTDERIRIWTHAPPRCPSAEAAAAAKPCLPILALLAREHGGAQEAQCCLAVEAESLSAASPPSPRASLPLDAVKSAGAAPGQSPSAEQEMP